MFSIGECQWVNTVISKSKSIPCINVECMDEWRSRRYQQRFSYTTKRVRRARIRCEISRSVSLQSNRRFLIRHFVALHYIYTLPLTLPSLNNACLPTYSSGRKSFYIALKKDGQNANWCRASAVLTWSMSRVDVLDYSWPDSFLYSRLLNQLARLCKSLSSDSLCLSPRIISSRQIWTRHYMFITWLSLLSQ